MRIAATELARRRAERGLSQRELAALLKLKPSTLSAVENGWRVAWPKLRRDCARILGVEADELFPANEPRRQRVGAGP